MSSILCISSAWFDLRHPLYCVAHKILFHTLLSHMSHWGSWPVHCCIVSAAGTQFKQRLSVHVGPRWLLSNGHLDGLLPSGLSVCLQHKHRQSAPFSLSLQLFGQQPRTAGLLNKPCLPSLMHWRGKGWVSGWWEILPTLYTHTREQKIQDEARRFFLALQGWSGLPMRSPR